MRARPDLRVYVILDPAQSDAALDRLVREAAAGGATLFQLRDKAGSTRDMVVRTRAVMSALAASGPPLLVNDRIDVALAAGARGAHIGQDDMSPEDARRLLGPSAVIGLTVRSDEEAEAAPLDLLDYVAIGGVFATMSKANPAPPIGLDGLARLSRIIRRRSAGMPVCAIAGISAENAAEVVRAGADGVAVISAVSRAPDPRSAVRALRAAVEAALETRTNA